MNANDFTYPDACLEYELKESIITEMPFCCAYDPLVRSTLLRWGNCDSAHGFGNCQFNPAEIPGAFPFVNANAVPTSNTLPASFFLPAKPATWWNTPWGEPAWPP